MLTLVARRTLRSCDGSLARVCSRALSTQESPVSDALTKPERASKKPSEDGVVKLVRWAKYGATLKPEDVGSVIASGKLPGKAEPADVASESSLPTVRPRIKLQDPLRDVEKDEIVFTVRKAPPQEAPLPRALRCSLALAAHPPSVPLPCMHHGAAERGAAQSVRDGDGRNAPSAAHGRDGAQAAQAGECDQSGENHELDALPLQAAAAL